MQVSLLAIGLRTPENIGMLFRVAEAFGVKTLYFSQEVAVENRVVKRISRHSSAMVAYKKIEDIEPFILDCRARQFKIIALETAPDARSLYDFSVDKNCEYLVLVGAERYGIDAALLRHCDQIVSIPMYGVNSSMNVACSTSVLLYEFQKQNR